MIAAAVAAGGVLCLDREAVAGSVAEVLDFDRAATKIYANAFGPAADRDFDRMPDGWSRRRGPDFPFYVGAEIDRDVGRDGPGAFVFRPDGGPAAVYGPTVRVDDRRTHVLQAYVRTEGLRDNAVVLSVSVLDDERRRIARHLSVAVSGTHEEWQLVRVGPIRPVDGQVFLVVGCHLLDNGRSDLGGMAAIDDLELARLPRLELSSNYKAHFRQARAPVDVRSTVGGLEPGREYRLGVAITDGDGLLRHAADFPLETTERSNSDSIPIDWQVPPLDSGFYHVRAVLADADGDLLQESTSFAVMDLRPFESGGRFGWSLPDLPGIESGDLARIAAQAGVSRVKIPVWKEASSGLAEITRTVTLCDELRSVEIEPVGLFSEPPDELRRLFARDWQGAGEAFALDGDLWGPTIEPVVARFSSHISDWQLGTDRDPGFTGSESLPSILRRLRDEFAKVGRDARLGVPWSLGAERPSPPPGVRIFLTEGVPDGGDARVVRDSFVGRRDPKVARWVTIRGERAAGAAAGQSRAALLVRRLVDASISGADAIDLDDVFDPDRGLLRTDGSPTALFLPYRATTWALRGAEYLGEMRLPEGSTNHVFVRPDSATMIVWNAEPKTEAVYLGSDVSLVDMQGRVREVATDVTTGRQVFDVGPEPVILIGGSAPVAQWRDGVVFDVRRIGGRRSRVNLTVRNTFPQGVSGEVEVVTPRGWNLERSRFTFSLRPGETATVPLDVELPPNVSSGPQDVEMRFELSAERTHRFAVRRTLEVGSQQLRLEVTERVLPDGRLEITQIVTNEIDPEQVLDFECRLFVPGQKRRRARVARLGRGTDRKVYVLPDAESLLGRTLWIRAEEENGSRVLNYRWTVGESGE